MPDDKEKKSKEKKVVVINLVTPPPKKDTFGRFEEGINHRKDTAYKGRKITELKFTATDSEGKNKIVKIIDVVDNSGCFCGEYYFDGDRLYGPNVIYEKKGSLIKPSSKKMDKKIKAIVLHRTAGWDTSGAIGHSKGTHFYIDKSFIERSGRIRPNVDGEIYQPFDLT